MADYCEHKRISKYVRWFDVHDIIRDMVAKPSKAERVYTQLRADILSGRLQPGERLRYTELCERYGTSMGVLPRKLASPSGAGIGSG